MFQGASSGVRGVSVSNSFSVLLLANNMGVMVKCEDELGC